MIVCRHALFVLGSWYIEEVGMLVPTNILGLLTISSIIYS